MKYVIDTGVEPSNVIEEYRKLFNYLDEIRKKYLGRPLNEKEEEEYKEAVFKHEYEFKKLKEKYK